MSICVIIHNPLLLSGRIIANIPQPQRLNGTHLEVSVFWEFFGQENVFPISFLQEDEGKIVLAKGIEEYLGLKGFVVLMLVGDFVNLATNRNEKFA